MQSYGVRTEVEPKCGEMRFRIFVLYSDGRIRPLPTEFADEPSLDAYISRWTPELEGKRIEYLQLVVEASRIRRPRGNDDLIGQRLNFAEHKNLALMGTVH